MTGLRVAVVDDEPIARRTLVGLLRADPQIDIVAQAGSGPDAVEAIREARPDLVFLDVQMPGMSGFEVLETLGSAAPPLVVFVTAYDEYAIRAFEVAAVDYLLKPFDDGRFAAALERAKASFRAGQLVEVQERLLQLARAWSAGTTARADGVEGRRDASTGSPPNDGGVGVSGPDGRFVRLVVRTAGRVRLVDVAEIEWIEAADYYARLHVGSSHFLIRASLSLLEAKLDPERFVRVHRSAIVRIDRVRELRRRGRGNHAVVLVDGKVLPLSRTRRARVQEALGISDPVSGYRVTTRGGGG